MSHDDATHRTVVARLTGELAPVRRLWSPWARLAVWLVVALGTVGIAAAVGLRDDLRIEIDRPRYVIDLAVLLAGAGLAATMALLAAVPGRMGTREARRVGLGLLALAVAAGFLGDRPAWHAAPAFGTDDVRCVVCIAAFGLMPWIALVSALRRAAPLDGRTTALCAGAAAFLVGAAAVRVACPYDDVVHLVVWHGLPVAFWAMASTMVAGTWLARWASDTARPERVA